MYLVSNKAKTVELVNKEGFRMLLELSFNCMACFSEAFSKFGSSRTRDGAKNRMQSFWYS